MEGQVTFVTIPKNDYDKLMKSVEQITKFLDETDAKALTNVDIPRTLTMEDIKHYYGFGNRKVREGVKKGEFPLPIAGFDKPKRWNRADVEALIRGGRLNGVQAA